MEDSWEVESIETDLGKDEIYIRISCQLEELVDVQTGELCTIYDHAPERHGGILIRCITKPCKRKLPRIKASNGKVKTASGYERYAYLFERAVIDLLKAIKNPD